MGLTFGHGSLQQFRAAIINAGFTPPEVIIPDGKPHRFSTNGKPTDDAGWYIVHEDGIPAGVFGDWRSGTKKYWRADPGRRSSPQEEAAHLARVKAMGRQVKIERSRAQAKAQEKAAEIWQLAIPAPDDHLYIQKKGVQVYGLKIHDGMLVVPMRDGQHLHNLQIIGADGKKRFLTGGRVKGCYFAIGTPNGTLCIAEGYATGAAIHEATGHAVAVAFSTGNLLPVAQVLRGKLPDLRFIFCADDDTKTTDNPGLTKAREAAAAVGGYLAVPDFGESRPEGAKDFNDLHAHVGLEAVRVCVEQAAQVERTSIATATVAVSATDWPEPPQSLDRKVALPEPYPLEALPGAVGAAVREYQTYGQQPVALVASSALAAVSLAAQGLADVTRDERLSGPLSLFFLVVAQSGERKTAADGAMGSILGDWESERKDALEEEIKRSLAKWDAWVAEHEGIKAAIKTAVRKKPGEAVALRQRLVEHALEEPKKIIAPRLRYEDVNPQSLPFNLEAGHPSAALWSDEGGMVTGSHGMGKESLLGYMAVLNRFWDGGSIHQDRKQAQSVHVEGRRLTVSLMLQEVVLRELTQRSGGLARGSGFLARFLIAAPLSTMGRRLYREPPHGMPCLASFHSRIRELLNLALPLDAKGRLIPPQQRLSAGAFSVWRDYHDAIERDLRPMGEYATVCDFAAKSAENAVRIAGCLHVFDGGQGAIPHETMQRAATIAHWYLREALRIMDVLDEPQAWVDARLLDSWLAAAGDRSLRDVLRLGPGQLRDKKRRDDAIAVLVEVVHRARVKNDGKQRILSRHPALSAVPSAAPATPATVATSEIDEAPRVAEVAIVTVAEDKSPGIERGDL